MDNGIRVIREYEQVSFRYTKGEIDIFHTKQFHPYYEMYLLLDGRAVFVNGHMQREIKPNYLVIIPPGECHRFAVEQADVPAYTRCVLMISPQLLKEGVLEKALDGKELLMLSPEHRIIKNILYLKDCMERTEETDFEYILSAVAIDLVFLIKQHTGVAPNVYSGGERDLPYEIMRYINENYRSEITLQEIADRFFLSVSSVAHQFKQVFGTSIKKYITEKRMNEIHICLQNGEKPQELANRFGFTNYSTFYRSYCRYFDVAPSQTSKNR